MPTAAPTTMAAMSITPTTPAVAAVTKQVHAHEHYADHYPEPVLRSHQCSFKVILPGSALLWCFAARRSAQAMAVVLVKHCNAGAEHHRSARRVGLSASMAALRLLQRTMAIRCEARLALNADRPTEPGNITLKEHKGAKEVIDPNRPLPLPLISLGYTESP